jgi:membrane-bound serine protease (ClpP class)
MDVLRRNLIYAGVLSIVVLASESRADVVRLKLDDQITPASAEVVATAIERAERTNASAIIIVLDTPGGLDVSMREIASRIIASKVPVVIYVGPSGARAASAGFVILLASDVAAMAPGTATGAAHPVMADGRDLDKTMNEKIVNDASAYVRSLAEKRGRDAQAAESTIRESRSFTEREALEKRLIEIIARDEWDLLSQIDGRSIKRFDGSELALQIEGEIKEFTPSIRQRLLMALADPRIAFVLFALGALCVYFEFQHPGAVVPGVIGSLSVVLALYGFHMLPINLTGVLLIVVAIALFVLEAKVQGFGILGLGGIVAAIIGSLILVDVGWEHELRLPIGLVLAVVLPFAGILTLMLRLAFSARRSKVSTGASGMIGLLGRAQTTIAPEGMAFVRGELWKARSKMNIAKGEGVRVIGLQGLSLEVEAEKDSAIAPKEASAVEGS